MTLMLDPWLAEIQWHSQKCGLNFPQNQCSAVSPSAVWSTVNVHPGEVSFWTLGPIVYILDFL